MWSNPSVHPPQTDELDEDEGARPLAESLLLAIADLLFCPDFTVHSHKRGPVSDLRQGGYVSLTALICCFVSLSVRKLTQHVLHVSV